ncbi:pyruvate kinase [Mycolicibacterium fluoranthenivorans]|nr:pyruvate kinase [Mycolicibacterium fluoranthenivorans]
MPTTEPRTRTRQPVVATMVGDDPVPQTRSDGENVRRQLLEIRDDVDALLRRLPEAESTWSHWLADVAPQYQSSARNMVQYWAIRQYDLRDLQARLSSFGLSSLGRSEPHVEATLHLVRAAICATLDDVWRQPIVGGVPVNQGPELLQQRTRELLGPDPADRTTRIMVTLPSAAATDAPLVRRLVEQGMNVARINCAHDDATAWRAMAQHVAEAATSTGRTCMIAMDLGGPKLRTGPLEPGPRVVKLKAPKNALGQVVGVARAWLTAAESPTAAPEPGMVSLPVSEQWLTHRHDGDIVHLIDTRGAKRRMVLSAVGRSPSAPEGFVATVERTTYLGAATMLQAEGDQDATPLADIPPTEQSLVLHRGDILELTKDCSPAPVVDGGIPRIGCTLPELFDRACVGHTVHLDDGRIRGRIVGAGPAVLRLQIEHAADGGSRLRAGKGVNVPGIELAIPALTDKDVADLAAVVELADLVEMSFVREPSDIARLLDELARLDGRSLGVVLKVETRQAFEHLPQLLLTLMRHPRVGVMIARGDLAVECGYERLAELQEEILWLCEAAHLPVIWATQVLEQLARTGNPSRAEISDAAMSERAECVMLNKGPHVEDAVGVLDDILTRMADHHYKKTALLPSLHSWQPERCGR